MCSIRYPSRSPPTTPVIIVANTPSNTFCEMVKFWVTKQKWTKVSVAFWWDSSSMMILDLYVVIARPGPTTRCITPAWICRSFQESAFQRARRRQAQLYQLQRCNGTACSCLCVPLNFGRLVGPRAFLGERTEILVLFRQWLATLNFDRCSITLQINWTSMR